jgi:hypothetical protein
MSAYIGIGGVAKSISKMYIGVDGKARQVQKAYIGVNGVARLWYQRGTLLGSYEVGKTVKIAVSGKDYDWLVVHQGIPDAGIYDASCNGTWLLMKDIYENSQWRSSGTNDYANSTIHSYLNSTFLNLLEPNIKNAIKQVKLPYRKGGNMSTIVTSGSNGLSAKIFLLSATETSFNFPYMPSGEGAELAYFKGCADDSSDFKRIAFLDGSATYWWLRSPFCADSGYTITIDSVGDRGIFACYDLAGIRPCIILPQDATVDDTGHVVA